MHLRFSLSGTALADLRAEYAIVKGGSADDMPDSAIPPGYTEQDVGSLGRHR